jgi:stage III sporulation protein AB
LIELAASTLGQVADRMRYLQPSMGSLLDFMCGGQFEGLGFPARCRELTREGVAFPDAWHRAVTEHSRLLGKEEAEILAGLDGVLGRSDLDSQLAGIDFARERLMQRLEIARERARKYGRLYRSTGILAGLAAVIMFI